MNSTYLGLIAGAFTSTAIIPQVVKTYQTKKARDLSLWQPVLHNVGMILWLLYGMMIADIPLIIANSFSIACNSLLIVMKFSYAEGDKSRSSAYSYQDQRNM